jgi:hypothetical protein
VTDEEKEIVDGIIEAKNEISQWYGKLHVLQDQAKKYAQENDVYQLTNGKWFIEIQKDIQVSKPFPVKRKGET